MLVRYNLWSTDAIEDHQSFPEIYRCYEPSIGKNFLFLYFSWEQISLSPQQIFFSTHVGELWVTHPFLWQMVASGVGDGGRLWWNVWHRCYKPRILSPIIHRLEFSLYRTPSTRPPPFSFLPFGLKTFLRLPQHPVFSLRPLQPIQLSRRSYLYT